MRGRHANNTAADQHAASGTSAHRPTSIHRNGGLSSMSAAPMAPAHGPAIRRPSAKVTQMTIAPNIGTT